MTIPLWQHDPWQNLMQRLTRGALAHALLLSGPAGLGKQVFASSFAQSLLCSSRQTDGSACGNCKSCRLMAAGSHPDFLRIGVEEEKSQISVDQIRTLGERLALSTQFGGYQIAIIAPAEDMNASASNALLKTLEEPTADSIIMLVSHQSARLSATIRSRCQRIDFRTPSAAVAQVWLEQQGISAVQASLALQTSDNNPGLALEWLRAGTLELREQVAGDLRGLIAGRSTALEVANRWSKADPAQRLWFAALLAREEAGAHASQQDGPLALSASVDFARLSAWFDHANRARDWLRGPVRPELTLFEVLSAWCGLVSLRRKA
jgi:DNA polymerase-3 subunit delta'